MKITDKYFVECSQIKNRKGCWNSTRVEIFQVTDKEADQKIGEYVRNYGSYGAKTFYPFRQDDKDFALISDNYTRTKVISLPDCKDVAEEPIDGFGFCPVEFYIPDDKDANVWMSEGFNGQFGFVSGCVWGDDSSWKIRFLDLSKIQEGVIENDNRFGYIELPEGMSLCEAIGLEEYDDEDQLVNIACRKTFDINERCDKA